MLKKFLRKKRITTLVQIYRITSLKFDFAIELYNSVTI